MGRRSRSNAFASILGIAVGVSVALVLVAAPAGAAGLVTPPPGSLDTSFASVGYLTNDMVVDSVVVQPDHKIVVAGQVWGRALDASVFGVYRYLPNGTPDPTFGSGGKVVMKPAVTGSSIGLALQPNGKLVVSGQLNERVSVVRLRANGALDLSFSGDGVAYLNADGTGEKVMVDPTGMIDVLRNDLDDAPSVMQLNPNGTLDKSFGKGGIAALGCQFGQGMALQGSQILVAGSSVNNTGSDFCVERLRSVGTPSPTFGTKGVVHGGFSSSAAAYGITSSAAHGTITAVGTVQGATPNKSYTALARFHLNGSLDTSFGTGGRVITTDKQLGIRSRDGVGYAVVMDGADTLLAGATNSSQWLLARYTADGSLDKTFGTAGRVSTFSSDATANAVAMDGSKIVVAGYYNPNEEYELPPDGGIARYFS